MVTLINVLAADQLLLKGKHHLRIVEKEKVV